MEWGDRLILMASQFACIGVDRFHRAGSTVVNLLLVILGDQQHLVARRKPPAETLNLLRRVRVKQLPPRTMGQSNCTWAIESRPHRA